MGDRPSAPPARDKVALLRYLRQIARRHGGRCLAEEYTRGSDPVGFECKRGHRFEAKPARIFRGNWCPVCRVANTIPRKWVPRTAVPMPDRTDLHTCLAALHAVAQERGGRCVSDELRDLDDPFEFVCAREHRWFARPALVLRNGSWCARCASFNPKAEATLRELVARHGGELIGPTYLGWAVPIEFACSAGHHWSARPSSIRQGSWCPTCARQRRPRGDARDTNLHQGVNTLAAGRGGRCLDSARPTGKLWSFECAAGHTWRSSLHEILGGGWCARCGENQGGGLADLRAFAQAWGGECLATRTPAGRGRVSMRCGNGHEWMAPVPSLRKGHWCPRCAGREATIADMQKLAGHLGGRCLSARYGGAEGSLRWVCAAGHEFRLKPRQVREGSWCRICDWMTGTLGEALERAREKGGALDGEIGTRRLDRLRWRYAAGHTWLATTKTIAAGHWCPTCADTRLSIEEMQLIASRNLGRCLSEVYVNASTKLLWQCQEGHQWWAMPMNIKNNGQWYPTCRRRDAWATRRADAKDRR